MSWDAFGGRIEVVLAFLNIGPLELLLLGAAAVLLFGGDLPDVARKAARTTPAASPELDWGLAKIAGRSPALLMRVDLNRGNHGMARIHADSSTAEAHSSSYDLGLDLAEVPHLWLTSWSIFQPRRWSGGLRFDLGAVFAAGQEAAARVFPAAR